MVNMQAVIDVQIVRGGITMITQGFDVASWQLVDFKDSVCSCQA